MDLECHKVGTDNTTIIDGNLQIINLSSYVLSDIEVSVLSKGLSFAPMGALDKFILTKDLYLFCRQLSFKMLYHQPSILDSLPQNERQAFIDLLDLLEENENPKKVSDKLWHLPSQATPSFALFPTIQIFYNLVSKDIAKLNTTSSQGENFGKKERLAVKKLKDNPSFVIKKADKGGNIVLWPIDMYLMEAKRQLNNISCYQVLPSDPTSVFKKKLDRLLLSARHNDILSKKEHTFLTTHYPVVPTLYLLPKVHKSTLEPPGSFVQDSSHLIRQLQVLSIPQNTILVTMDVESLYTCIGHSLGIEAVTYFFNQHFTALMSEVSVEFLDLEITKVGTEIRTMLFRKSTAANSLLHFSSFHPWHLRKNIPKGQFLREKSS
ncbi:uncharacterized protein [Dendrobates tinctorius]|uniref:uncharacterized protein n=1 Tax=Dendrobates tinctorius TaxID=92724 RepID=UPI003CC9F401